ncbi:MAG: DUF1553 domain-containing protein [Planctomycetaceae bacterium]|nr:DUF1553 domain-containing protein [Planctomycetaceae bacterium]
MRIAVATRILGLFAALSLAGTSHADAPVRFNRDVRPILADTCFKCHGPDSVSRQADLRLDREAGLRGTTGEGAPVVSAGDAAASELYRRLITDDPSQRMPPADSGRTLSAEQIDTLRRWIEEGAAWEDHWAFLPPARTKPPAVNQADWAHNGIDHFVLAELERRGWSPSSVAADETLIRRVTLDLTGLPPTPAEVQAFCDDTRPERYELLVDRLLASPRFGEHMAVDWLDAARFADTSGYQTDGPREMYRWRDWVIAAYNADMPFDQFTIDQLAGDLLPNPNLEQQIATGFNRNHRANSEGGIIPEEYEVEYVVDRVDTTSSVWLGLTIGCARCHEHKYDPISHEDYYRLFAYFNKVPEYGRALKLGNSPPYIPAPTPDQAQVLERYAAERDAAADAWRAVEQRADADQRAWEESAKLSSPIEWTLTDTLDSRFRLDGGLSDDVDFERVLETRTDSAVTTAQTEAVSVGEVAATFTEGPMGAAMEFDGASYLSTPGAGRFGFLDSMSVAAWVRPEGDATGGIVSRMTDDTDTEGWALHLRDGHLQANLVNRWLDDSIRVESVAPLKSGEWQHVVMTYDGSRWAAGVRIYVNGEQQPVRVLLDAINSSFVREEPLRIGSAGNRERFTGAIADVRLYRRELSPRDAQVVSAVESIDAIALLPPAARTAAQAAKLQEYFLTRAAALDIRSAYAAQRDAAAKYAKYVRSLPNTMVMTETGQRQAHVLMRGAYDKPGAEVSPGVPQSLLGGQPDPGGNRLDLAHWIVDSSNPLTARVAVNRLWQKLFGNGLVKTSEDFGTQGEPPSHPELLDWLATEFVRTGWDQKALLRKIVTSATYRQSSSASPENIAADPENRWLSRGPRFRMPAEMVRDQALAVAGLLQDRLGGPSVKPYQPDGLWQEIASDTEYVRSTGPDLYRRSLYAFVKRTVANPTLVVFDSSTRESCILRRTRTNTPLQALTLLNDVTFVEAARVAATRVLEGTATTDDDRLSRLMALATSRTPAATELDVLRRTLAGHREHFRNDPAAAAELIDIGDSAAPADVDPVELAAFTLVASLVLNLDEVITKE